MFKKLKERIESVDESSNIPKRPPGLAVRSPPADTSERSITQELLVKQNEPVNGTPERTSPPRLTSEHDERSTVEDNQFLEEGNAETEDEEVDGGSDETTGNQNVAQLQSVLTQLIDELASVRSKYDTLVIESEKKEEELRTDIIHLEARLDQKTETCNDLEGKFAELKWTVENLTSRLQLYSSHDENETIGKLQSEIVELNRNKTQRDLENQLLETRIAALTRKHHDEQTSDNKTIHKLQQSISTLQKEFQEKDNEARKVLEDFRQQQKHLYEINRERENLQATVEKLNKTVSEQETEIADIKLTHSCEMEVNGQQHQKAIKEMDDKLKAVQAQLKDKEDQLKRVVTELPDQPIAKAVLDGYSRTKMVTSFSNTIMAPGTVLKRDNQPVVINDNTDDEEPAILPVENDVSMDTEYSFTANSQALLLKEIKSLRSENEQLTEDVVNKDQTIRVQQQKISDMRKALSKGLKSTQDPPPPPQPQLPLSLSKTTEPITPVTRLAIASEVNFQYLKNVVVRFICSRDDEATQLLRAITTLLELSTDEEKYIRDYLQYKMSWFGSIPSPPKTSIKNSKMNDRS